MTFVGTLPVVARLFRGAGIVDYLAPLAKRTKCFFFLDLIVEIISIKVYRLSCLTVAQLNDDCCNYCKGNIFFSLLSLRSKYIILWMRLAIKMQ